MLLEIFLTRSTERCVRWSAQHLLVGHTVVRLSLRPRINRHRRRRPFIRILGSARVQMQVILLFKKYLSEFSACLKRFQERSCHRTAVQGSLLFQKERIHK